MMVDFGAKQTLFGAGEMAQPRMTQSEHPGMARKLGFA
jgi:hypothetical protein